MRTVLLGAGFIGALHARNLASHPGISLAVIVEPAQAVGVAIAEAVGAAWRAEPGGVLEDPDIDVVWIATPASTHTDLIRRAARAGKHVFCEKPVGVDLADVDRLLADLEGVEKPVFIGFNRRFDASHARLKRLVAAGAVGAVEMVSITSRDPRPPPVAYMQATPGGVFYDTMIHDMDLARWLLGAEPTQVYATASCHLDAAINPDRDFDAATATLKTAGGAVCQIAVSRRAVYGYDQRLEVFGSRGMAQSANHHETRVRLYGAEAISEDPLKNFFIDRYADAFRREIDEFLAACRGESTDYPDAFDGRQALALSLAALASARANAPVALSPMPERGRRRQGAG